MWRILWLGALLLGVIGVFGSTGDVLAGSDRPSAGTSQQVAGNGVTVIATLLKEQPESTAIKLALDTYFFNLVRYDFEELAILRDENGKTYPVTAVEQASSRKPRYREAVLRFPKVAPGAKVIELIVKDVAGVKERTFRWNLTD